MDDSLKNIGPLLWNEFPQPLILIESNVIVKANEVALQMFQVDDFDGLKNITFETFIAEDSTASGIYLELWNSAKERLEGEQKSSFECLLRRATGELFWSSIKLHSLNGKFLILIEDKSQYLQLAAKEDVTEIRAIKHNVALKKVAKLQATKGISYDALFKQSTQIIKETLSVKQVSFWLFNQSQTSLKCIAETGIDGFDKRTFYEKKTYPAFFETIVENNIISINTDNPYAPFGRFFKEVLKPQSVQSIFYMPIADIEKVVGFIAIEHMSLRTWHLDEQSFVVSIAEVVAQSLASHDRKAIREQLFVQERLFKTLVENSTDVFAIIDENAICNYISPSIERIFGYSTNEILGNNGSDRLHDDDKIRILNRFKISAKEKSKSVETVVFKYKHKKGHYHYVECVLQNQIDNPLINGLVVNFRIIDDRILAEKQQKENIRAQYQLLKTQVNPHFLFNCLNTLASLIYLDEDKAEDFVLKLASVYRYLLENRLDETVKLSQEFTLVKNYLFLQKFRFEDNLKVNLQVPEKLVNTKKLIALSLQLVLENAVKHNEISSLNPLNINIYVEGKYLIVSNNFQPRREKVNSTGLGIPNIKNRYALVTNTKAMFYEDGGFYYSKLPLLD